MPLQKSRIKDSEKPWVTNGIRELFKKKTKVFKKEGYKSEAWKRLKRALEKSLFVKKEQFYKNQVKSLSGASKKNWHRRMKILMDTEPSRKWNVKDLWPTASDKEVAEKLATHFNNVSKNFTPVNSTSPVTYNREIPSIPVAIMSARLKSFKKPASTVPGDLPPCLLYTSPSPRD